MMNMICSLGEECKLADCPHKEIHRKNPKCARKCMPLTDKPICRGEECICVRVVVR